MDITKDNNPSALYHACLQEENLPDFLKEASIPTIEDVNDLHDNFFADPVAREHPIHTPAATVMSGVYLAGQGKTATGEFARVKKAAEFFQVSDTLERLLKHLEIPVVKRAQVNHWGLEIDEGNFYPLNNETQTIKAATDSIQHWYKNKLEFKHLVTVSKNIVKRANELNIDRDRLPDKITQLGVDRIPQICSAEDISTLRERHVQDNEGKKLYEEIIKLGNSGSVDPSVCVDLIRNLDALHGIDYRHHYSPDEIIFSGPETADVEKAASDYIFIAGVPVPTLEVVGLTTKKEELVKRYFNKEGAEKVAECLKPLKDSAEKTVHICAAVSDNIGQLSLDNQKTILSILLK